MLVNFGAVSYVSHLPSSPVAPNALMVRIQEVTHDQNPQLVFDVSLFDYGNSDPFYLGYWTYRSHRVPDLYAHPAVPVADLAVNYAGGVPLLQFSADPVRTYVVQTSPDLKNWSVLGTAETEGGGLYDFYDTGAFTSATTLARYYRVQTQ